MSWFWRNPKLYEQERKAWETLGFSIDQDNLEKNRRISFTGLIKVENDMFSFEVDYPPGYPHLPPQAKCLSVENAKHQTPVTDQLCLFEDWADIGFVAAETMHERLVQWARGHMNGFKPEEESEAYELSRHYLLSKWPAQMIAPLDVYSEWKSDGGIFTARLIFEDTGVRGFLESLQDEEQHWETAQKITDQGEVAEGFCFNVDEEPPYFKNGGELVAWLETKGFKEVKQTAKALWLRAEGDPKLGPLIGVKFPENGTHRFLAVALEESVYLRVGQKIQYELVVFEPQIFSEETLFKRVESLRPLKQKHAVIVGLGAIGSPLAVELAKAGVGKLTLVDHETMAVGNAVRHVGGVKNAGLPKTQIVADIAKSHNPFIEISQVRDCWGHSDDSAVEDVLREADIVICAVGHSQTERYIDEAARRNGKPAVYAWAGSGAWSGRAFRVIPNETGCYHCHQYAIDRGELPNLNGPTEDGAIYETGCAGPAYPGSGLDTGIIANLAARLAMQTMLRGTGAYEDAKHDHIVWRSQSGSGELRLIQKPLKKGQPCPYCELSKENFESVQPEAKALLDAMTDWETAVFEGDGAERALAKFTLVEREFRAKKFKAKNGETAVVKRVRLKNDAGTKSWVVECEKIDGTLIEIEFDEFFGYDFASGFPVKKYEAM